MKFSVEKIFYYSAILFAFAFPLSRAIVSFFIIWFILLFLLRNDYRSSWKKIKANRVFHAMGAFIALLALSILWSADKTDAINQIRLYSYWIIIPILAVTLKKEWLSKIITAFLGGMLISIIIAYGIYFELWTINDQPSNYPNPFMSHIHYSVFLALTSMILFYRLLSDQYSWKNKSVLLLFLLATIGNLFLSTGRTGQLAFMIAMIIAFAIRYHLTIKSFFIFFILTFTLLISTYTSISAFQERINMAIDDVQQFRENNYGSSLGIRTVFWIATYDILQKDPLLGVGVGDYKHAAAQVLEKNNHEINKDVITWCTNTHFHNQYLMILAQVGLIGFAIMLWLLFELFQLKIDNPELKAFSVLGLTVFIVGCIAEPLWIMQFPIILFVFITSISIAASSKITINQGS